MLAVCMIVSRRYRRAFIRFSVADGSEVLVHNNVAVLFGENDAAPKLICSALSRGRHSICRRAYTARKTAALGAGDKYVPTAALNGKAAGVFSLGCRERQNDIMLAALFGRCLGQKYAGGTEDLTAQICRRDAAELIVFRYNDTVPGKRNTVGGHSGKGRSAVTVYHKSVRDIECTGRGYHRGKALCRLDYTAVAAGHDYFIPRNGYAVAAVAKRAPVRHGKCLLRAHGVADKYFVLRRFTDVKIEFIIYADTGSLEGVAYSPPCRDRSAAGIHIYRPRNDKRSFFVISEYTHLLYLLGSLGGRLCAFIAAAMRRASGKNTDQKQSRNKKRDEFFHICTSFLFFLCNNRGCRA